MASVDLKEESNPEEVKSSESENIWPKGSSKTAEIAIGGTKVRVRTDSTPSAMRQVRDLVDLKFEEFSEKLTKGVSAHQLTVLVAFNLAEELLKEKEKNRLLKKNVAECTERLIDRVEARLGSST